MSNESKVSAGDLLRDRTELWILHDQVDQGSFVVSRFPPKVILGGRRLLLVEARWINPLDWAPQVYRAIHDYLKPFGEDLSQYVMLVDLYGIVGPYETSLFLWQLWLQDDRITEELQIATPAQTEPLVSVIEMERQRLDSWWSRRAR